MKARIFTQYRSRNVANDTFAVTLENIEGNPYPVDDCQYSRQGNKVIVNGQPRDEAAAEADAKRVFSKTYDIKWA